VKIPKTRTEELERVARRLIWWKSPVEALRDTQRFLAQVMTYERDPRYGYLMRPRQMVSTYGDPIEINALGLRGPPLLEPKPEGVVRVLFLGDSITYGGGRIHEGELFCRRIENAARDDGFRLEPRPRNLLPDQGDDADLGGLRAAADLIAHAHPDDVRHG